MNMQSPVGVTGGQTLTTDVTAQYALGTEGMTRDGRHYRYVQAGAADLIVGNVIQSAAQITAHQQMTPSVVGVGAQQLPVTAGAAAGAANLYAGGLAIIDTAPGNGYAYGISSHPAIVSGQPFTINLVNEESVQVALSGASRVSLATNPWKNVIQAPVTALTGSPLGVAIFPIPAGQFGWIQTQGPCAVLIAGTPAVGNAVVSPGSAAGAVVVDGAAAPTIPVGVMLATGVDGKNQAVLIMFP